MTQQIINVGAVANDRTGDSWRASMVKSNDNFTELYDHLASVSIVYVAIESDFPVQDSATITLEANQLYIVTSSLTTAKRFICESGSNITMLNRLGPTLTYTGTSAMFTGTDVSASISNIKINAPSGALFAFSDVAILNTNIITIDNVFAVSCVKTGTFTSLASISLSGVGVFSATQGITFVGTGWRIMSIDGVSQTSSSSSFIGFDFGAMTIDILTLSKPIIDAPAGAIGIKGLASSGNVTVGNLAKVVDSSFLSGVTPLSGITVDDIRWFFSLNDEIPDTMPDALSSMSSNSTETVITTISTPVKVAGTFVAQRESHFTCDTAGRCTYNGERDIVGPIDIVATVKSASGSNKDIQMYLAINGVVVASSLKGARVGVTDPHNITVIWQAVLSPNDYIEAWLENTSDTINLVATDLVLRIR